jgi:RNA polymerase sigma-70 factor (ECF subfamily)
VEDRQRLAHIFEDHAAFVARTLRRLGVPDADMEDALQDVFVVAQAKLEVIEDGKERGFLFAITRSRASSVRRSISRTIRRIDLVRGGEERIEHAPDSGEQAEKEHARAVLDTVLDELALDLRTVLVLHELEELELTEIADLLEIPIGTVASRLRRAREKFEVQAALARALLTTDNGLGHDR